MAAVRCFDELRRRVDSRALQSTDAATMERDVLLGMLLAGALGSFGWYTWKPSPGIEQEINRARAEAERRIRARRTSAESELVDLDLDSAFLVHADDDAGYDPDTGTVYTSIRRIYRNPAGSYFLVIGSHEGNPYITLLSRRRAMNALRDAPEIFVREFPGEPLDAGGKATAQE